jgi:Holliday junction resolvase
MAHPNKLKGNRGENRICTILCDAGAAAQRVPLSGALGGEFSGDILIDGIIERRMVAEVKSRKPSGVFWNTIKKYLSDHDMLFLLEDRQEPLVVMPVNIFTEILNEKDKEAEEDTG